MFANEALTDFTLATNRMVFQEALNALSSQCQKHPFHARPIIDGKELETKIQIESKDPSELDNRLGAVCFADTSLVVQALSSLKTGANTWAELHPSKRIEIIRKLAQLMRNDRHRLSALIVREAGKPWKEADADVVEAIDFCNYYAQQMLTLGSVQKTAEVLGEDNIYFYQPRGIVAVISPWNFPLAILCGMAVAALITGNAVAIKPAEQTSLIAFEFAKLLLQAGVAANAIAYLPGYGEEIGRALVESPDVDMICFTGSKAVGLEIIAKSTEIHPGQKGIKKVIAELGGKNAIIVDEDADLDEAIKAIIYSAFGYSGQKCSACSRVIAVGDAYETLLERLKYATQDVICGPARNSNTLIGPVIDKGSQERLLELIQTYQQSHKLLFKGETPQYGYFVPPCIFYDVDTNSALWKEELFGPILACVKAETFKQALQIANESEYALTGAVFSRSPENLARARREFKVGNLYINRSCTGAIVCRQPFGGFKMSGIGSKAGGPDYLIQFVEPRTITENTMRRGFAPETKQL